MRMREWQIGAQLLTLHPTVLFGRHGGVRGVRNRGVKLNLGKRGIVRKNIVLICLHFSLFNKLAKD